MKKRLGFLVLFIIGGLAVYSLWPKTTVEKPLVVVAQIMESDKTMSVSYIIGKGDDTHLMEVTIDGKGYYPPSRFENGKEGKNDQVPKEVAVQNGYRLLEATIQLTDEEVASLLPTSSNRIIPAELSFENYKPIQADFIMLLEEEAVEGDLEESQLHYTFTAPESLTVSTVGHYSSASSVSWSQDGKNENSAIFMEKGDMLDIYFDGPYQMGSTDALLVEIQTEDDTYYTRHLRETVKLPDGYLKQIVDENRMGSN